MLEHVTVIYAMHAGGGSSRLGRNFSFYFTLVWFWFHFIFISIAADFTLFLTSFKMRYKKYI